MRSLKIAITTACLALAATSFTPASAGEQFELPASVDSSLLSLSALPIYGPVIAYMVCASESSPGMPPGHCLREALTVSSY